MNKEERREYMRNYMQKRRCAQRAKKAAENAPFEQMGNWSIYFEQKPNGRWFWRGKCGKYEDESENDYKTLGHAKNAARQEYL